MKQVFISYSSKDYAQAQAVRHVLEQNGITCWMAPADIPGGSNYTKEIPIAIRGCQAFVLMLSDNAQKSHWVLKELDSAVNEGKIILPFQLEDVPLSDEFNFLLTGAQRYDAYQRKSEALNLLVARIKAIIGTTAPEQPQPEPKPEPEPQPAKKKIEFPTFQMPKKEESKQAFSGTVCPACGSLDVAEFPDLVRPRELSEHLLYIGLPIGMVALTPIVMLLIGFILVDNSKTSRWYAAREINRELAAMEDAFLAYRNLGAFTHKGEEAGEFARFSGQYRDFTVLEEICCDTPLLIGAFAAKNGDGYAFTAVNLTDPGMEALSVTAGFRLARGYDAVLWQKGVETMLTADANGYVQISLDCGEGAFIEVRSKK